MTRRTGRSSLAARAGGAALAAALLLTGCAGDVDGELRREVADLTDAVNDEDADDVRDRAESLIARTQEASDNGDIGAEEGARIIELATLLRDRYAALQPTEPSPTPSPTPTEETETEEPETETETETETEQETEPPPTTRPPSPRPTQAPPSPRPTTQAPSPPPEETLLPEAPEG